MARSELTRYAFNRGLISPLGLARLDLKRNTLSAQIQTNWMPRALGSMMLRPGLQYIGATRSNAAARYIEFVRSLTAMHLLEFTNILMRVWTNDVLLTRVAVSTAISNGTFPSNLNGWDDLDEAGATSAWDSAGVVLFTGNGTAAAIREQQVTVAGPDKGKEHALRILVNRGPLMLRVGSTSGADDYIAETELGKGFHSLAFTPNAGTPTAPVFVRFFNRLTRTLVLNSCDIEASGVVTIPIPYVTSDNDNIRGNTQSLSVDVMFVACAGYQQLRIERRQSGRSWSVVCYQPEDGPFRPANVSTQTMTSSVLTGNGTLTSSVPFFKTTHAPHSWGNFQTGGALFTLTSQGQAAQVTVTAQNQFTAGITVTGVGNDRLLLVTIDSAGAGTTIRLQSSFTSITGPWTDVAGKSWTAAANDLYLDALDNQIVYYRLGCKTGDYGAGTLVCTLQIPTGSVRGIARVIAYTSPTVVSIEVLSPFSAISATVDWAEGLWSDYRGWPTAVTFYEGRLGWGGFDQIELSVSDAFDSFDPDTVGDSGPINRTIGSGPMDTINWMLPLERLVLGAQLAEHSVRTSALDEPISPSNFNRKACSTQGSTNVQAVKVDKRGIYVQRGGSRVFELEPDPEGYDYQSTDLTVLNPEVCRPNVVRMAIQRRPDTRLHCVLSDGTAAVLVYDHAEKVMCWIKVESPGAGGLIEDVVVLPGLTTTYEDQVYYQTKRTIMGATVRYLEKWALETQCEGGTLNRQADAFIVFVNGSPSTAVSAPQLAGSQVVVWQDGVCPRDSSDAIRTYIADPSGNITLDTAATTGVVGLAYTATFQSAKLGQALSEYKNIDHIAPVLYNTHAQGLEQGPDFDNMDNLPLVVGGAVADPDTVYAEYDDAGQEFIGTWSVDARICLRARAPRPCTLLAVTVEGQTSR